MKNDDGGASRDERFQDLYRRFFRRMVRYFMRVSRLSEEDAEELTQEAFARFLEAMDEYRGEAEWAYFEVIARNVLYNKIRSSKTAKRKGNTVDIDDPEFRNEPVAPEGPDYAERQQTEIRRRQLYEAIEKLPAGQRQCLMLWLQEFKFEEIARALNISLDAVKSRLRDARRLLGARLGQQLPEEEQ
ncbi:MAG: RNA polymerase sigma factor [Acidobacteriota bacterium]